MLTYRRIYLLLWFLVLRITPGFSQFAVGIEGGYTYNQLLTNGRANRVSTQYRPATGISIGIPLLYQVNNQFAVVSGPAFFQKNYRFERTDFYAGTSEDVTNTYVQLPLMGRFSVGGQKLKAFVDVGVFGGYWAASHGKGTLLNSFSAKDLSEPLTSLPDLFETTSYNQANSFDSRQDNRWEAGWVGGLGVGYALTKRFQLVAEGRYWYSFTNQHKPYASASILQYNDSSSLTLGLLVSLFNK